MSGNLSGNGNEVPKICKVCGGKATGYHFGVMSCEGCKGFFRRNVKKNARFICNYDKNCDVTGEKRKNCQACRMARCESSGMRRDRIMMTERRKNRRTEEKKARLAAEAAAKTSLQQKTEPDPVPSKNESSSPTEPKIVKTEFSADATTSIIPKTEITDASSTPPESSTSYPIVDIKTENFHPASTYRGDQTTIPNSEFSQLAKSIESNNFQALNNMPVVDQLPQYSTQFPQAIHQIHNQNFVPNYQHMVDRYVPGYPAPSTNVSTNTSGALILETSPWSDQPSENESQINYFHERTRNESLGSPQTPTSVSQKSFSCSSSLEDIRLAKQKSIDVEMSHIKAARHASYISRHVREKRRYEEEEKLYQSTMSNGVLEIGCRNTVTSNWLNNSYTFGSNDYEDRSLQQKFDHQPLTTPNGSMVGSARNNEINDDQEFNTCRFSLTSNPDDDATDDSYTFMVKRTKYMEFFADLMECGVKEIVSYCKLIPEFSSLDISDQEHLLRNTILELLILKCYFNYKDGEFLNGVNGIWLRREDFILATKDVPFIDNLMQLMDKMAALMMTEEDTLLLMLVTLFSHDSPSSSTRNRETILVSKKYFVSKMLEHMNRDSSLRIDRGTECLLLLPLLRTLNNSFVDVLSSLSHSRTVDLGPISHLIYELKPELKQSGVSTYTGSRIPQWPYAIPTSPSSSLQELKS